ncbi:MAG: hypothetical protein PHE24_02950 [Patescibacteria group bacterium]|nr:hypothetical protein [Patescibacteria group bacterium]
MKHFTRTEDFTKEEYLEIFRRTEIFEKGIAKGKNFTNLCPGMVMATMFFQESTRTAASLQAAMVRLGGGWFGIAGIKGTYLETGEEDLDDTLRGVAPLCDIMGIRHKSLDLTELAAKGFPVPLINAMSGSEEHSIAGAGFPYAALHELGRLEGLKIGIYGMSKSSRPMKAAAKVLSLFGVEFYEDPVIPEFKLPEYIREMIKKNGSTYQEDKLANFIGKVDYLFVIEGLPQAGEDPALVDKFNKAFMPFSKADLAKVKKDAIIDVGEPRATTDGRLVALKEVDDDPRMSGKKLLKIMVYCEMAIITYLLGIKVK